MKRDENVRMEKGRGEEERRRRGEKERGGGGRSIRIGMRRV